jgi:hypothetical protein
MNRVQSSVSVMIILSEEQFCWFSAEPAGIIAELNAFP